MELHSVNLRQPISPGERLVVSVTEAAALLGISRALGYELAARERIVSPAPANFWEVLSGRLCRDGAPLPPPPTCPII